MKQPEHPFTLLRYHIIVSWASKVSFQHDKITGYDFWTLYQSSVQSVLKDFTWKADNCEQEGSNIQLAHSTSKPKCTHYETCLSPGQTGKTGI